METENTETTSKSERKRVKHGYAYNPETGQKELVKVAVDVDTDEQYIEEVRTSSRVVGASIPAQLSERFELARDALMNMLTIRFGFRYTFSRLVRKMVLNGQIEERDGEDYLIFKL